MSRVFLLSFLAAFLACGAAPAQVTGDGPPQLAPAAPPEENRLERLYGQLKRERSEPAANRIANLLREEWNRSGSATIDLIMHWADEAAANDKFDVALDLLDQVTLLEPDHAEGWNRRAIVHLRMRDFSKAMSDLERALDIEPRHFEALSGMASILKAHGRDRAALDVYMRVLAIYPMLRSAQNEVSRLADELTGEGI